MPSERILARKVAKAQARLKRAETELVLKVWPEYLARIEARDVMGIQEIIGDLPPSHLTSPLHKAKRTMYEAVLRIDAGQEVK